MYCEDGDFYACYDCQYNTYGLQYCELCENFDVSSITMNFIPPPERKKKLTTPKKKAAPKPAEPKITLLQAAKRLTDELKGTEILIILQDNGFEITDMGNVDTTTAEGLNGFEQELKMRTLAEKMDEATSSDLYYIIKDMKIEDLKSLSEMLSEYIKAKTVRETAKKTS